MIKKLLLTIFLMVSMNLINLQAKNEEYNDEEEQEEVLVQKPKGKRNKRKINTKDESKSEIRKYKKFEALLLGNRFDTKRIAAYLTSVWGAGLLTTALSIYIIFFNQSKLLKLSYLTYNLLQIPLMILIHKKLLQQYKVDGIPTSLFIGGPIGQLIYAQLNKLMLSSAFKNLLENYDPTMTPDCVKKELDSIFDQYYSEDAELQLNFSERTELAHEILAKLQGKE